MPEPNPQEKVVRLVTARDPQEAQLWRQALDDEGIRCQVVGEFLGSFGVAPPGRAVPEVWVGQADAERARHVLQKLGGPVRGPGM